MPAESGNDWENQQQMPELDESQAHAACHECGVLLCAVVSVDWDVWMLTPDADTIFQQKREEEMSKLLPLVFDHRKLFN